MDSAGSGDGLNFPKSKRTRGQNDLYCAPQFLFGGGSELRWNENNNYQFEEAARSLMASRFFEARKFTSLNNQQAQRSN